MNVFIDLKKEVMFPHPVVSYDSVSQASRVGQLVRKSNFFNRNSRNSELSKQLLLVDQPPAAYCNITMISQWDARM